MTKSTNINPIDEEKKLEIIVKTLKATHLFTGLKDDDINALARKSDLRSFSYYKSIWNHNKQKNRSANLTGTPLMIIASGVAAVAETSSTQYEIIRINALVMPFQLIGEFQWLGDEWPAGIDIRSFGDTSVVFIEPAAFEALVEENCKIVYKNLAQTLKEKLNIANYHFLVAGAGDALPKLAVLLDKILEIPGWAQVCDLTDEDKYKINIYWNFKGLSQLISSKEVSLKSALAKLILDADISVEYFDHNLKTLGAGEVVSKPKETVHTPKKMRSFQITVLNKSDLWRHCLGGRKNSQD